MRAQTIIQSEDCTCKLQLFQVRVVKHSLTQKGALWLQNKRKGSDTITPLKKGQKLTDNPKNVSLNLRLTKDEADNIQYCADKLGTNRTAAINLGIKKLKDELEKGE